MLDLLHRSKITKNTLMNRPSKRQSVIIGLFLENIELVFVDY